MQIMNFEVVSKILEDKGIDFEVITFTDEVIAAREVDTSADHNYDPKNAIKTLVIRTKDGFKAVVLKGSEKIDGELLETIVGKWSVIDEKTLLEEFGFVPGTVCPLALEIPILIDKSVLQLETWSMGTGDIFKGFNINKAEVAQKLKFSDVEIALKYKVFSQEVEDKFHLITRNCQEVLTEEDLKELLASGKQINHYIGFEISGLVHLGTGLMSMGKIADFIKAEVKCKIFLADFHSFLNNKLGGNWENIRWASQNYFKQALIASLKVFGVEENQVEFVSGKELYETHPEHWQNFMEIGKQVTLSRNLRSISIMGKKEGTDVDMATLFYPPLQVADIVTMDINLAHAGMDQRKAHVIARDAIKKIPGNHPTPIAIHQNLIAGLTAPESGANDEESLKMSKSKPGSAIFVHDTPEEIREKLKKAYGPPKEVDFNPLLNWVKTLVFWGEEDGEFTIERPEKFGGNKVYLKYTDVVADYASGELFPLDLKNSLAEWLIKKLEPVRAHFEMPEHKEALEKMKGLLAKK
ncbi:tyrosine--tRNA ligase [Candidatus Shapirobacteria bacterium]|nr:tyrosine--tRNA ligase [Candidatus Shapirobacteria bacterium]